MAEQTWSARLHRWRKRLTPEVLYTYTFPLDAVGPEESGRELLPVDEDLLAELKATHGRGFRKSKRQQLRGRIGSPTETCYVIREQDGTLVGWCHSVWTSTRNERINHPVPLTDQQVYLYDDYVFPAHRGRGLHSWSIRERARLAAARGRTQGVVTITKGNDPSIASYRKVGSEQVATLVHLPLLARTVERRVRGRRGR